MVSGEMGLRRRWAGAVDPFDYAQGSITHPLQNTQRMGHPDSYPYLQLSDVRR
jgi:hypothetical protein